jgi:hypothetical protein
VARIYAGILCILAFLTALARGAIHGDSAESSLWLAWCCLWVFAAVGYVLGWIGEQTIEQSVITQVEAELAAQEAAEQTAGK